MLANVQSISFQNTPEEISFSIKKSISNQYNSKTSLKLQKYALEMFFFPESLKK